MTREEMIQLVSRYVPLLAECDKGIAAIGLVGSIKGSTWRTELRGGRRSDVDLFLLYSHTPTGHERREIIWGLLEAWRMMVGDREPPIERAPTGHSWYLCGHALDLHPKASVSESADRPLWLWFRTEICA